MKKLVYLLLGITLVLAACSNQGELKDFTKTFNENSYEFVGVDILKEESFGEIKTEKYGKWKKLYELEDYYSIEAKYNDDEKLTGYYISIEGEQPYENLEGVGFEAALVLAKTLDLDRDRFIEEFQNALAVGDVTYNENGYEIILHDFSAGEMIVHEGMIINFNKASE